LYAEFSRLMSELDRADRELIEWSCPVPFFGHIETSEVATVGINPSNREFVNQLGAELVGAARRLPTLRSLGLGSWGTADYESTRTVIDSCRGYFDGKPYDSWFGALQRVVDGTGHSYYGPQADACHVDIVPWATSEKWGRLAEQTRRALVSRAAAAVIAMVDSAPIRMLVLNGQAVVRLFQELSGCTFESANQPDWSLARAGREAVSGISYRAVVDEIEGIELGAPILVLGYNHNLQSSFGVTTVVRERIRDWISHEWEAAW
jgi:hypothetical protein